VQLPLGRSNTASFHLFHLGRFNTQTHSPSGCVLKTNNNDWASLLDETTDDDANAIDDISQLLDELQEEQEQEQEQGREQEPSMLVPARMIPAMPPAIPTIMIPSISANSSSSFKMPKIPMLTIPIFVAPVAVMQQSVAPSIPKVQSMAGKAQQKTFENVVATTTLTRKQRVQRWKNKRHLRNWGKKNTKNEYYGLRKTTAAKRKRTSGKFSGSNVSWVSCS